MQRPRRTYSLITVWLYLNLPGGPMAHISWMSTRLIIEQSFVSYQFQWSNHWRRSSTGGWAPYVSLAGMFTSSTNTTYTANLIRIHICMSVCHCVQVSIHIFVWLSTYHLSVCLYTSVCFSIYVCLPGYLPDNLPTYRHACLSVCFSVCIPTPSIYTVYINN